MATDNTQAVAGQVVVITGGGRGLGRLLATSLAEAGMRVVVVARSAGEIEESAAAIRAVGGEAHAFSLDVTDGAMVKETFAVIASQVGPVDLLINNAALAGPIGPLWKIDPDEWWRTMDVNVRGPFLCCAAVLPGMIARGNGRIINVSSGAGTRPIPFINGYVVSKCALLRLTDTLSVETAPHGIAVFAISPGTMQTDMTHAMVDSAENAPYMQWFRPLYENADNDQQAALTTNLVITLASGRADALSGRFLTVADDLDAVIARADEVREQDLYWLTVRR